MKRCHKYSFSWTYLALVLLAQNAAIFSRILPTSPVQRGASKYSHRWMNERKGGNWIIPYVTENFGAETESRIRDAIKDIHANTCLRFVPRTSEQRFVRFIRGLYYCNSFVGMTMDIPNEIYISSTCGTKGAILHEIMHTLGFYHEHSRPDRDKFIKIVTENIIPGMIPQFKLQKQHQVINYGAGYDLESIMHYPLDAFSRNGENTITGLDGENLEGLQNATLSMTDIYQINKMYKCKGCVDKIDCRTRVTPRRCKRDDSLRRICRKSCGFC